MAEITIIRRNVKYARISIGPDMHVKVVLPLLFPDSELRKLLVSKEQWIDKQLTHFEKMNLRRIAVGDDEILFFGAAMRRAPGMPRRGKALEEWYRTEAKKYFLPQVAQLAFQHGFSYNKVIVRGAKSRWGSCSAKKNISLNWRLMKAPAEVIDYVILHELVHTVHFDHSKKFWQKLEEVCPGHKRYVQWLKDYGHSLS